VDELAQRTAGEVAILVVDCVDPGSLDGEQFAAIEIEPPAQQHELAKHGAERRAIVAPKVSDGLEVGPQAAQQPEDFDVAMGFTLQPAARRTRLIAVDIELQQVSRRIARTPRRLRHHPGEPRHRKVQPVDEGVNEPNRIVRVDVIVHRLRQQQELVTLESGNVAHARF